MSPSDRSHSRTRTSRSRPRNSRDPSAASISQVQSLILPDGTVGEEATQLLQDFVHPRDDVEETLLEEDEVDHTISDDERDNRYLPWWKRPSPLWLIVSLPFSALSIAATVAPRIEIYTILACSVQKPEYNIHPELSNLLGLPIFEDDSGLLVSHSSPGSRISPLIPIPILSDRDVTLICLTGPLPASNYNEGDDNNTNRCSSEPEVQAAVAKLTAVMAASMGILSCLTASWWGAFSDRYGRTRVMTISAIGLLLADFNFIFVSLYSTKLPGGYWFFLAGPILEGCLGGMTSGTAAAHAYVSDITEPRARSRIFSLFLGVFFTGIALGPTLGGLLIRLTHNALSVFYAAAILHLIYATFLCIVIPESLSRPKMVASQARYQQGLKDLKEAREGVAVGLLARIKRLFGFLSPLMMFIPKHTEERKPLKGYKMDWNLTLVAAGFGFMAMILGSYPYKFQYASAKFHWSSEILEYYLSMVGIARAAYLTVILPVGLRLLIPKPPPVQPSPNASLFQPSQPKEYHSPSFDLNLARGSLFVDMICFTLLGLAPTPIAFVLFTLLASFDGGFAPALQSVALELYSRRGEKETGRLFGALSVLQALSSQIVGPAVFGFIYIKTVAVFPEAIFFLSTGIVSVSLILLSLVRVPNKITEEIDDDLEDRVPSTLPDALDEVLVDIELEHDNAEADIRRKSNPHPGDNSLVDV